MCQLQFARAHQQVLVRRSHVDPARKHDLSMLSGLYLDVAGASQQFWHHALVPRRNVLHYHDATRKILGKPAQSLGKGMQSPRRGTHRHHVEAVVCANRLRFAGRAAFFHEPGSFAGSRGR